MSNVTEEDVWEFVENTDFSRDKKEIEAKLTLNLSPAEVKGLRDAVRELEGDVRDAALEHEDKPDWVSEDGMAETAGALIAKGRERYYEVLENPGLWWDEEYEDHGNPIVSSYLPYRRNYRYLTDAYYRQRGEQLQEKYEVIAENDKYAEGYREDAADLYRMLTEPVYMLAGRSQYKDIYDDGRDWDDDMMIELAENLEDDVDPRFIHRLVRRYRLYRDKYFDL